MEQLTDFRERVRGLNQLEPDFRDELLNFIDTLSNQLETLLHKLPLETDQLDEEQGKAIVRWYHEYKGLIAIKAKAYVSPENVSEATLPTGVILNCTALGTLVGGAGGAAAGAVVGGMVTNQIKPAKAAEELMKSNGPDGEAP